MIDPTDPTQALQGIVASDYQLSTIQSFISSAFAISNLDLTVFLVERGTGNLLASSTNPTLEINVCDNTLIEAINSTDPVVSMCSVHLKAQGSFEHIGLGGSNETVIARLGKNEIVAMPFTDVVGLDW